MARIVTMKDKNPLVLKPEEITDKPVSICRCGLSGQWPYCDGSHSETRSEEDGKTYSYHKATKGSPLERAEGVPEDAAEADPRPE